MFVFAEEISFETGIIACDFQKEDYYAFKFIVFLLMLNYICLENITLGNRPFKKKHLVNNGELWLFKNICLRSIVLSQYFTFLLSFKKNKIIHKNNQNEIFKMSRKCLTLTVSQKKSYIALFFKIIFMKILCITYEEQH